ncbi:heparinase II/III domain-containing protein [Buttiauxella sp.]|uniref:heparinase II/III domain-containing protein n=1 Tax=Buttiauxella sp. TaxID=1972222 RepID=UPI003C7837D8
MSTCSPLFIDNDDATALRAHLKCNTLLGHTLRHQQQQVEQWLKTPLSVPGHGEGGGPEHMQHKFNYQMMNLAGRLWLITQDRGYKDAVIEILSAYADRYPQLGDAISHDSNPPGRLFHQTLNEHMFLLYAAEAWHCVKPECTSEQIRHIESNLLRLMAHDAMHTHAATFDIVHNHGMWSVAAVAICGYVLDDKEMVLNSLYGLARNSKSGGFFAQLDQLFSIDGYYIEGLYYQRFALRPLLLLAEAISRRQPELNIWQYQECLIKRACYTLFALAFPDGTLPALNDASKTMDLRDEGAVMAVSLCWQHYGADSHLAELARFQATVWPGRGALLLADHLETAQVQASPWPSQLIRDGQHGERGAIGLLRVQDNQQDDNMALLYWGGHGNIAGMHSALNHGHFDGLHLSLYNRGREFLRDYGFGRWVNIEPKFGGRYIPENNSYCKQTLAHNTVVVDEGCQHQFDKDQAALHHGETHFFITNHPFGQGMSARCFNYWPDVNQQRTVLMLNIPQCEKPLLLDLYSLSSAGQHQYDYCLHGRGQLINTSSPLDYAKSWHPLGKANGYQHLWDCARSQIEAGENAQLTWLDGDTFYSATGAMPNGGELIVAQTGASDPQFNLRVEPAWLWRTHGNDVLFATVIESHGYFDEATEISRNARGHMKRIEVLEHDMAAQTKVVISFVDGEALEISVDNRPGQGQFTVKVL